MERVCIFAIRGCGDGPLRRPKRDRGDGRLQREPPQRRACPPRSDPSLDPDFIWSLLDSVALTVKEPDRRPTLTVWPTLDTGHRCQRDKHPAVATACDLDERHSWFLRQILCASKGRIEQGSSRSKGKRVVGLRVFLSIDFLDRQPVSAFHALRDGAWRRLDHDPRDSGRERQWTLGAGSIAEAKAHIPRSSRLHPIVSYTTESPPQLRRSFSHPSSGRPASPQQIAST